ncbi:MAG: hypothetical protein ACWA5U_01365, partial [bacterium]
RLAPFDLLRLPLSTSRSGSTLFPNTNLARWLSITKTEPTNSRWLSVAEAKTSLSKQPDNTFNQISKLFLAQQAYATNYQ